MHPYAKHKEVHAGKKRAGEFAKRFASGGAIQRATGGPVKKTVAKAEGGEVKAEGKASGGRLDKRARGGGVKKKGHHTHINIMVAPKGGDGAPPPGLGAGGPPMGGAPPMVPKAPMVPPPGGALGAGPPGMPPPPPGAGAGKPPIPGMMSRGGIASKGNLAAWSKHASSNTRYAEGGAIAPLKTVHMKGGAGGANGRVMKAKAYGLKARKGG